jgi:hypothetical protein
MSIADCPNVFVSRAASIVLALFVVLMLTGCLTRLRPASDIMARPLDATVDADMIFRLVEWSTRDRICAARQGPHRWHAVPYQNYIGCMQTHRLSPCDATAEDLRTVHTLMDRDPRLLTILSFKELLMRLRQHCPSSDRLFESVGSFPVWHRHSLRRCEDRYQPVLITMSIMLGTVPANDESWVGGCTGVAGYFFLERHCWDFEGLRSKMLYNDMVRIAQGIEPYFCPQIVNRFDY